MTYFKRVLVEWNSCRIVRSLAGLSFIVYGFQLRQWPVIVFGLAWLAAGLFSFQCCTEGNCYTSSNNRSLTAEKEVDFEEIK